MSLPHCAAHPLVSAYNIGQSIWLDNSKSRLLHDELHAMICNDNIMGINADLAISEQAMTQSTSYDEDIKRLVTASPGISPHDLYTQLAIIDLQAAADTFANTYQQTQGRDGLVNLAVPPSLAHDAASTIAMAVSLHKRVNRPNLMIKVPATPEGIKAVEALTALGINVNATLIYSITRYRHVAQAYIRGLERRLKNDEPIDHITSVASLVIACIDSKLDAALRANGSPNADALIGTIAIANAKVAYGHFANLFGSNQFSQLKTQGAHTQRLLWVGTGAEHSSDLDVPYVEELMGPDTIHTLSPETLDVFKHHGVVEPRLTRDLFKAHNDISALKNVGISFNAITNELERTGLHSLTDAFDRLLGVLAEKRQAVDN